MRLRVLALGLVFLLLPRLSLAEPAQRVVSMNPSLTAILLAIGARSSLVGVDEFSSREQPAIADLPTVGGLYNPGLEAVVALGPDLVVLVPSAEQRDFRARLATLEIPFLELNPVRFEIVVGFPDIDDARPGDGIDHLIDRNRGSGRQVQDFAFFQFTQILVGRTLIGDGIFHRPGYGGKESGG